MKSLIKDDPRPRLPCPPKKSSPEAVAQKMNEVLVQASPRTRMRRDVDDVVVHSRKVGELFPGKVRYGAFRER